MIAAGRRRSATELAHDLATRLGGITQRLHATGAGVAMPVDAQRLCEIVHAAYNPRAAELLEEARASGGPAELAWEDVGPVGRGRACRFLLARRRGQRRPGRCRRRRAARFARTCSPG